MSGKGEENGRGSDSQVPMEDLERNQKILQWMMEGEALRHKKSAHRYCDTRYTFTHTTLPQGPMVFSYLYEGTEYNVCQYSCVLSYNDIGSAAHTFLKAGRFTH